MALANLVENVRDIIETPLTQPLDMVHVFLIVGVVLVSIAFWLMLMSYAHGALVGS